MQGVCIKKRIALTALEAAHCPAAQKLKVPISSNWGGQKSCCWEGVHQQSVALQFFQPAQIFPPLPLSRVHLVSKVSQTPKYSLPQKFQCQKTVMFAAYCII